jgi:hypothetical protein
MPDLDRKPAKCPGFLHKTTVAVRLETVADWLGRSLIVAVDHGETWCLTEEVLIHA